MTESIETNQENSILGTAPRISQIEILGLLGQGGMSSVYKARQRELDRIVAVKVLLNYDEHLIARFQSEAKLSASLDHPNIIKTLGFGISQDGHPYLIMEFLEGKSLSEEMKDKPHMGLSRFKQIFLPVLEGLEHAHAAGLVHRDIKPSNIMICKTQVGGQTVKIVDFGIAKYAGEGASKQQNLTKTGVVVGSPRYMSPEQCNLKNIDQRSDIYSLSCVMYEALTGRSPFESDSALEVMHKHLTQAPPDATELAKSAAIPKQLAEIIVRGLQKDPAARPQTASELHNILATLLDTVTLERIASKQEKGWKVPTAIAGIALCIVGAGIFAIMPSTKNSKSSIDEQVGKDLILARQKASKARNLEKMKVGARDQGRSATAGLLGKENNTIPKDLFYADPNLSPAEQEHKKLFDTYNLWKEAAELFEKSGGSKREIAEAQYGIAKIGYSLLSTGKPLYSQLYKECLENVRKSASYYKINDQVRYVSCRIIETDFLRNHNEEDKAAVVALETIPDFLKLPRCKESRAQKAISFLYALRQANRMKEGVDFAEILVKRNIEEGNEGEGTELLCRALYAHALAEAGKLKEAHHQALLTAEGLKKNKYIDKEEGEEILSCLHPVFKAAKDIPTYKKY